MLAIGQLRFGVGLSSEEHGHEDIETHKSPQEALAQVGRLLTSCTRETRSDEIIRDITLTVRPANEDDDEDEDEQSGDGAPPENPRVLDLQVFGIRLTLHSTPDMEADDPETARPLVTGTIESDLHERADEESEDPVFDARMDGLESLILACACAGVDVATPAFLEAIETSVDAILNRS